jgi:polyribonucleotide nucleotidyltransferase
MRFEDYKEFPIAVGGRPMIAEIGKVAEQANGAVTVRYGETVVNVTACMAKTPREGIDFFPLSCEYEERMYAAGKIPGGFIKREGRPSEKATLSARLMDRPLRPLFPKGFRNDVQIVATILCVDPDCPPEMAAMIGSSIALSISDIPFDGPTASVIRGVIDDRFIVNPTLEQRAETKMSLTVSGTRDAIMMVEAGAQQVPEEKMIDAIFFAHDEIKKIVEFIDGIVESVGKAKIEVPDVSVPAEIAEPVRAYATDRMRDAIHTFDRTEQSSKIDGIYAGAKEEFLERFEEAYPDASKQISSVVEDVLIGEFRGMIINEEKRPDGRGMEEIRQIWCETGFLPRTHGSGLFKRGQTQALSVVTLGTLSEGQTEDGISDETGKR